jgi:hypothetical protein
MSNVFVERKDDGTYVARQNHQIIANGSTQAETAERAHRKAPGDPVFVERVRNTTGGSRDKWRRVY